MTARWRILMCVLVTAIPARIAEADERPITSLVPANCIVVYTARPYSDWKQGKASSEEASAGGSHLSAILTLLNASGLIPREGQVFTDIAARLPLLGRYEHALALLDVSSKVVRGKDGDAGKTTNSLRLKSLQSAAIFRTGGENEDVLRHLNQVVGRYTNTDVAKLTTERVGKYAFQRLVDERLIGWAIWEWGTLGDFFVVTFGEGAFARIARAYSGSEQSLAEDAWFKFATIRAHGDRALVQWFISLSQLEKALADVAGARYQQATSAIGADKMTHDLWTIGMQGRAMSWYRCYRRDGKDVLRAYSDPDRHPAHLREIVPDAARRYAIINVPTRWLVDNLPAAWLKAQSERHVARLTGAWERLAQETGIDIGKNLIDHLGENVVIFDYPPHPLKVPIALTVAIEINDRKAVQTATDALLSAWGRYLDQRAERKGTTLVRMYVKRADDGVWYIQAGILGPSMKVTDRYLVISWSPAAVREAVAIIESRQAKAKR